MEQNPFEVNNKQKNPFENKKEQNRQIQGGQIIMGIIIIILIIVIVLIANEIINTIADNKAQSEPVGNNSIVEWVDYEQDAENNYLDQVVDPEWTWNEDFIDTKYPNTPLTDAILFDDFTGEDTTLKFTASVERGEPLDLSDVEPGIYTIYNTNDSGYLYFPFSSNGDEPVFSDEAIYNIPITPQTNITLNNVEPGEEIQIVFEAQSDYIQHDSEHNQGLFITGKSLEDNVIYDMEFPTECYPTVNDDNQNDYSCIYKDEDMRGDIPGSFIFSHEFYVDN